MDIWADLKEAAVPAIHPSETNLKGLPGSEAGAMLRSRGLTIVLGALGCALFQVEPLPEACRLRGFWPRSLTLLYSNTSTLLLNSSLLQTWGQVIQIRVTGVKASSQSLITKLSVTESELRSEKKQKP